MSANRSVNARCVVAPVAFDVVPVGNDPAPIFDIEIAAVAEMSASMIVPFSITFEVIRVSGIILFF
jgi:hypothetical protein